MSELISSLVILFNFVMNYCVRTCSNSVLNMDSNFECILTGINKPMIQIIMQFMMQIIMMEIIMMQITTD